MYLEDPAHPETNRAIIMITNNLEFLGIFLLLLGDNNWIIAKVTQPTDQCV